MDSPRVLPLIPPDVILLRDATVGEINQCGYNKPIDKACSAYDVAIHLDKFSGGRMIVVPQRRETDPLTRGGPRKREIKIDIAVQYKATALTAPPSELDPYLTQAILIADHFERIRMAKRMVLQKNKINAACTKVEHPHLFMPDHLASFSVFTSVITLTFTATEA